MIDRTGHVETVSFENRKQVKTFLDAFFHVAKKYYQQNEEKQFEIAHDSSSLQYPTSNNIYNLFEGEKYGIVSLPLLTIFMDSMKNGNENEYNFLTRFDMCLDNNVFSV